MGKAVAFKTLEGMTFSSITVTNDTVTFHTNRPHFIMGHEQECCESVWLADVAGDTKWLINTPILKAEVNTSSREVDEAVQDVTVWTFYTMKTTKGTVVFRWCGSSNGYYSVAVGLSDVSGDEEEEEEEY